MDNYTCIKCEETKLRTEFYKNKRRKSGITTYCKSCQKRQARDRYYTKVRGATPPKAQPPKSCGGCGAEFAPRRGTALYCSPQRGSRARGRSKTLGLRPVECLNCGTEFLPARKDSVTCSRACYMRAVWGTRGYGHESRARFYGVEYQRISPQEIFDRDNWICGICNQPIDHTVSHPDPMSVSLDHIIPLSKGGPHAPENVQAGHLGCNVRKNATLPEFID